MPPPPPDSTREGAVAEIYVARRVICSLTIPSASASLLPFLQPLAIEGYTRWILGRLRARPHSGPPNYLSPLIFSLCGYGFTCPHHQSSSTRLRRLYHSRNQNIKSVHIQTNYGSLLVRKKKERILGSRSPYPVRVTEIVHFPFGHVFAP